MALTDSQTTGTLSDSVRTRYLNDYDQAAEMVRLYDQIAYPVGKNMSELGRGNLITVPFISDMTPGVTAISETVDVTPQQLVDTTTDLTPTTRGEAILASEALLLKSYTDYGAKMHKIVAKSAMESIDLMAQGVACKGDLVIRSAARASLDAGTSADRLDDGVFTKAATMLATLKCPGFKTRGGDAWAAIMHPAAYHDLREGGNIVTMSQYQNSEILLNFELGSLGPFRLVVSPWAKVFGAAGAANGTVVQTTIKSSIQQFGATLLATTNTNIGDYDRYLTIGTAETGSTHYPTNEIVWEVSHADSIVSFVGEAANGGLRFGHAAGTAVSNADNVYTVVFGGPQSLAKVYCVETGPFGKLVGPLKDGILEQWTSLGYKFYGAYGIIAQNRLVRAEVSASAQA